MRHDYRGGWNRTIGIRKADIKGKVHTMATFEPYQESLCFQDMELTEEILTDLEFVDCLFENCTLEGCKMDRCRFTDCTFIGCSILNLKTERSYMTSCKFAHCDLTGINWGDLMSGGYLIPIEQLDHCRLKYNQFVEMNFVKFDFSSSSITASMFADCNLTSGNFSKCDLDRTEFFRCNLSKADFRLASGYQIDTSVNQLKGARFSFPEVVNLLNSLGIVIE